MAWVPQESLYRVRHRFPSIKRYGLAAEYFPKYVHGEENLHSVDVVLLSVILRGRGRHMLGSEVHQVMGSSVGVTHYGQMHDIVTDARGIEVYNVYLDLQNHPLPVLPESLRGTLSAILPIHPRLAGVDGRLNAFPSLHAALTVYAGMSIIALYRHSPLVCGSIILWMLLLLVSTLTTKQHVFVDIVAGVIGGIMVHYLPTQYRITKRLEAA
jgi:membrane-associated phospholipid phosphatase